MKEIRNLILWFALAGLLGAIATLSARADTPGQVINKTCSPSQWFSAITKTSPPVCSQPTYADIAGTTANIDITGNADTCTAFQASPTVCVFPQFALGVDVSGNAICDTPQGGGRERYFLYQRAHGYGSVSSSRHGWGGFQYRFHDRDPYVQPSYGVCD
jgi:hypothetical protein